MTKKTYRLIGHGGRTALFGVILGALGIALIHQRSMAGQHRVGGHASAEAGHADALAVRGTSRGLGFQPKSSRAGCPCHEDCDSNGEAEPCDIDCNANTRPDDLDIYMATSRDCDADRMPDECADSTVGDLDGDGIVGTVDRALYATCHQPLDSGIAPGCESADQNGDGRVDCADWRIVRCAWTTGQPPDYPRCRRASAVTPQEE